MPSFIVPIAPSYACESLRAWGEPEEPTELEWRAQKVLPWSFWKPPALVMAPVRRSPPLFTMKYLAIRGGEPKRISRDEEEEEESQDG
jgi:hypothetical protein